METYVQASNGPFSPKNNNISKLTRRSANFHPSIWGDHFLKYSNYDCKKSDGAIDRQLEQLKEEVRQMLVGGSDEPAKQLKLIDAIQRLGVSYHFESEIDDALKNHLVNFNASFAKRNEINDDDDDNELNLVALRFRLLRQQGHHVSCDVFNKFKDCEGKFNESIINDTQGLLSLYESAHLRVHEEDILDEALEFTTAHLEQMLNSLNHNKKSLASQVAYALNMPIAMGLKRLDAKHYIPIYQQENPHNKTLLKLAKLDFNILQKYHQRELSDITRWWKDLNVAEKLPFARDRIVEGYFWILGVYFEPQYFLARRILTKVFSLTSVIDDIYDVYGTIEELILFTNAIQRWDLNDANQLPEYMRHVYAILLDVYSEIEEELSKEGKSYRIDYAKQAMKQLVRAYFDEANWYHKGYVPTMEEYMEVALVSAGYIMVATTSFVGMGELVTKQAFDWVSSYPLIIIASSIFARLSNDMVAHEFEQKRGHVASAVECYMKQHSVTKEVAFIEFNKRISNGWKDMNQECLRPTSVPMALLERVLNLTRVLNIMYKDGDGYTHAKTRVKNAIAALLIECVPI
ncbi:hypothetical protein LguiA_033687 [Lonicera macranthoides]